MRPQVKTTLRLSLRETAFLYVLISLALALCVGFLHFSIRHEMFLANRVMATMKLSEDLIFTLFYLSNEARSYVQDRDEKHLITYLNIVNLDKKREKIIQTMEKIGLAREEQELLSKIRDKSDEILQEEQRAIRLSMDVAGAPLGVMLPDVPGWTLSYEEHQLSMEEKMLFGKTLLFGSDYDERLNEIKKMNSELQNLIKEGYKNDIFIAKRKTAIYLLILAALAVLIPLLFGLDLAKRKKTENELYNSNRIASLGADIGVSLTSRDMLKGMLQKCTEAIVRHLDAAFARIWLLDEDFQTLELQASSGMYTHLTGAHSRIPVGRFKIGMIAEEKRAHLTNDVQNDPRVSDREWAVREGMIAFAGHPLIVENRLVGVMALFSRHHLDQFTLDALASIADEIAIGIERKRTEDKLKNSNEELLRHQDKLLHALSDLRKAHLDLQHTQSQLIQSEKFATIGKLAGMISHEFRNELGVMRNAAYFIKMKMKGQDEKIMNHLNILEDRIQETDRIIENIMSFAKTRQPNLSNTNLAELIYASIGKVKIPPNIKIVTEIEKNLPSIQADEVQLSRAFVNVILNAVQAIQEQGGEIRISANRENDYVRILVEDNGPGIPDEDREHLFEPLFTTKARGAGLGLATAQLLIESHDGTINIESEWGKGTTVGIRLPFEWPEAKRERAA